MIEIYLLEQLAAFREYGTLSAAAEQLHLAQPSLSRSMRKLEELLGVSLFDRQKNRIVLNQTGMLAAEHAKHILESEDAMIRQIRAYDRSLRTLTIGSCAPGPLMDLLPQATGLFADMTISSAVESEERLIQGLHSSDYGIIILTHPLEGEVYYHQEYRAEQLYLSVPPFHPAASYKKISFSEMDGQNFIMYAHVGFWDTVVRAKMPHSKFFLQNDLDAVGELARYSDLPSFSSDITQNAMPSRQNGRVNVPFSDPESKVTYYLICRAEQRAKWKALFRRG
jgi:DNA-binding transcriptional LysR family regulator